MKEHALKMLIAVAGMAAGLAATPASADFRYSAPKPTPTAQAAPAAAPEIHPAGAAAPARIPSPPPAPSGSTSATPPTPPVAAQGAAPVAGVDLVEAIKPPTPLFELKAGDTVRATFLRWCTAVGWTLVWSSDMDYPVETSMTFATGTEFKGAVRQVLGSYWNKPYALEGRLYKNSVLEISGSKR